MEILPSPHNPRRKILRGVELFYTGTHTDSAGATEGFTAADLDDMVRNFTILSSGDRPSLFRPPVGIGHSTAGSNVFNGDNRLAAGHVLRLWTEQGEIDGKPTAFLYGDLEVNNEVAEWVEDGSLTSVSAEVDDDPPTDISEQGVKGLVFRRVALLGFSLPALKRLRRIQATYAREPGRFLRAMRVRTDHSGGKRRVMTFCDVHREIAMRRNYEEIGDPAMAAVVSTERDNNIAWLVERGVDVSMITPEVPDVLIDMLVKLMQELETLKATSEASVTDDSGIVMSDSSGKPKKVTLSYSDLVSRVRHLEQMVTVDRKNNRTLAHGVTKSHVKMFCDTMRAEGRLSPAEVEVDRNGTPLPHTKYAELLRAAEVTTVRTFSDGGKTVQKTELELQMDAIRKRPAMRFSERIPAGEAGNLDAGGMNRFDAIRERVKASRVKSASGPSLEQRLNMIVPNGNR